MPTKRRRRPVLSTTSPPPETDPPSKRQKKGSQSQSLTIDYDLLADAILKKQNQFNPNPSTTVHHNVPPPVTEQISTSSVVPSGNACEQNHPSAVLSQNDTIPASQTVSLQVSSEPNQQPCPQPSVEPDTLSVPAVLNTLFGGESATNHDPQPLNFSNNIPLGPLCQLNLSKKFGTTHILIFGCCSPINKMTIFLCQLKEGQSISNKVNFKNFPFPLTNGHQHFSYMHPSSFRKHLLMQLISLNTST